MTITNGYITLGEYKGLITSPGQTLSTDTTDDGVIEDVIEAACRFFEAETGRKFYPWVETRSFSVPDCEETNDPRTLFLDEDLLAVTTLTNGDTTVLTTTDYHLLPYNLYPKYAVQLKDISGYSWAANTSGSSQYVITLAGVWGFHEDYVRHAWATGTTVNEGGTLNATDLTFTVAAITNLAAGQLLKIDSEYMIVASTSSGPPITVTVVQRGENGSTAATHADSSVISIWTVAQDIKQAVFEIANNAYHRRYGENKSGPGQVTPAGVVIGPADLTEYARSVIRHYRKMVY